MSAKQLIHQSKMGKAAINPFYCPPDASPQVGPIQTHVNACRYFEMCIRRCCAYHSKPRIACRELTRCYTCYAWDAFSCIQTANGEAERSVERSEILC